MPAWPGLGERIKQRIQALGYKNPAQFAEARRIRIQYIYRWISGATPDRENLEQLAKELEVAPPWLLFGDEVPMKPTRRIRKALVGLLLGLLVGSSLAHDATASAFSPASNGSASYRTPLRTWLRWLLGLGHPDALLPICGT